MVCKKSLYCLKNGPCANYQLRKQIWEDNIRFRESLRNLNQSDHYWSFQISNELSDVDEPKLQRRNKFSSKFRNFDDCASVTHEFSNVNDYHSDCSCKLKKEDPEKNLKAQKKLLDKGKYAMGEVTKCERKLNQIQPSRSIENLKLNYDSDYRDLSENTSKQLTKYRSSLALANLEMDSKLKCDLAQCPKKNTCIRKFPSMDVIAKERYPFVAMQNSDLKENIQLTDNKEEKNKVRKNKNLNDVEPRNVAQHKKIKLPPWLCGTPLSRTTRKMFNQQRQIPFATFGCNNVNDLIGSKRTHNVFASVKEVFPNALNAKQQREDLIAKSLRNERNFQNSLLQNVMTKKIINHSSLWANQGTYKDHHKKNKINNSLICRNSKQILAC